MPGAITVAERARRAVVAVLLGASSLACSKAPAASETNVGTTKTAGSTPVATKQDPWPWDAGTKELTPTAREQPRAEEPERPRIKKFTQRPPVDCGVARDNPHAYVWGLLDVAVDGTCSTCEAPPAKLPVCEPDLRAKDVGTATLKANVGKKVRFQGVVDYADVVCTLRGGRCACNNGCSAALRLMPRGTPRPPLPSREERLAAREVELHKPYVKPPPRPDPRPQPGYLMLGLAPGGESEWLKGFTPYSTREDGVLVCHGDEQSVCCPFELDRESHTARVIVEGVLVQSESHWDFDLDIQYTLAVEKICRVSG